jgi:predicted GNAT family acetyltransferase
MSLAHPLDRPVWSALTGRQSHRALIEGGARRFAPGLGLFAALADTSATSLADLGRLIVAHGDVAVVETTEPPPIPGAAVVSRAVCWQMIAETLTPAAPAAFPITPLTEADASEMLALATLTQPGPFLARTHQLGQFVGVRADGRLVAMAGERMRPDGFTEVSGVCTHPDHRGRGYAAGLMRAVAAGIHAHGEVAILHVHASNTGAIELYRTLGFAFRAELIMTTLTRA